MQSNAQKHSELESKNMYVPYMVIIAHAMVCTNEDMRIAIYTAMRTK